MDTTLPLAATRSPGRLRRWLGPKPAAADGWALWLQASGGDEGAATALVRLLAPQALAIAMQMLRQRADAEDVVQESFLRLWSSRPSDDRGATIGTYFNTIVLNRCKTLLTQRRELPTEPDELTGLADARQAAQPAEAGQPPPEPLRAALQALPARQRMALAMWAYADASVPEIAVALQIDVNAAHQLLHRARQSMKLRLARG